jgi:murein DD-endopeptidase
MLEIIINTAKKSRSVSLFNQSINDDSTPKIDGLKLSLITIIAIMAIVIVVLLSSNKSAPNHGEIRFNFQSNSQTLYQTQTNTALYQLPLSVQLTALSLPEFQTPIQPKMLTNAVTKTTETQVISATAIVQALAPAIKPAAEQTTQPTIKPSAIKTELATASPVKTKDIKSTAKEPIQTAELSPQEIIAKTLIEKTNNLSATDQRDETDESTAKSDIKKKKQIPEHFQTYTIAKGDNLSAIFRNKLNLPYRDIKKLLDADERALSKITPGQKLYYFAEKIQTNDDEKTLKELMLKEGQFIHHFIANKDEGFDYRKTAIEIVWQENYFQGVIQTTLTKAITKSGLSSNVSAQVSNVLGERLDFRRQVRIGDEFSVLVKQGFREGKKVSDKVLAIYYKGEKAQLLAVLNDDGQFYDAQGQSVQLDFLKRPYVHKKGMWISAYFGLRSVHPVTGKSNKAHNGTDYGMNIGTPILAAADGVVISSKVDKKGGEMLTLKHNEKYTTKYLHLSKRLVERGHVVKQGDTIALSGNTGDSTGPHLHYSVYINDKPFDSERNELPKTTQLNKQQTATLNANTKLWQSKLALMLNDKIQTAAK